MELEIVKNTIEPFSGKEPQSFGPWAKTMGSYMQQISGLTPLKALQIMDGHSTGDPKKMIRARLSSPRTLTWEDMATLYDELEDRYGSSGRTALELLNQMDNFPIIENSRSGDKLLELAELCKSALDRMDTCPEL